MSMDTKDTLDLTYNEFSDFAASKLLQGRTPFEIAAAMMALGAAIYKTTLSEDDFNAMMDAVSLNRDMVQRFEDVTATLQ
jgi:hypothetical protein